MVMPLWDESPFDLPKWPVVTWGLIIANIVVFVFELAAPEGAFDAFAVVPAQVTGSTAVATGVPPYVTLVTSMFLHANLLHIFGNMLFLWIFGDDVEEAMGPLRFLVFYLVCGIAAALAFVAGAPQSPTSLIGASGAIAGVLAAYLMFRPCQKVAVFIPWFILWLFIRPVVRIDAFWVLGLWIVTQFWAVSTQSQDGVAYMAHIGGFAAGLVLFPLLRHRDVRLFECVRPAPLGPT
jgi:rhomboid family protein